jgi:putative transposase
VQLYFGTDEERTAVRQRSGVPVDRPRPNAPFSIHLLFRGFGVSRKRGASVEIDLWAYRHGVRIDFSRLGKPTDNAFVESFNGTFRAECLDAHWFTSLTEAKQLIEEWRREYNGSRPHRALGEQTPSEFASQFAAQRELPGSHGPENSP